MTLSATARASRATAAPSDICDPLTAFRGPIAPVRVSFMYRSSLLVAAVLMVALPVLYVALIAALGYWLIDFGRGGPVIAAGMWGWLLLYFGPLVIGGILLLFMIKPLFAAPPRAPEPTPLDLRRERRLVTFIARLSATVGAPAPSRITLSHELNAYASLPGIFSREPHLTIGLPLVATMSISELAAVIAHEFGHFTQGFAMRASQIIWRVNRWFARVVYERDAWDEWLEDATEESEHWMVHLVLSLSRLAVWTSRRVLWMLMMIAHLFTQMLSRHMEFDADRYAVRLAGQRAFRSGMQGLSVTAAAEHLCHEILDRSSRSGTLVDDIPSLIAATTVQVDGDLRRQLVAAGLEHSAGMYDSHPALRDRLAAVADEPAEGALARLDQPAYELFDDFAGAARRVTSDFYLRHLELPMQRLRLVPVADVLAEAARDGAIAPA